MKVNEETLKLLVKSGLGWLIPMIRECKAASFKVELIDLDILSLGPKGVYDCSWPGGFWPYSRLLMFGNNGTLLAEVGGLQPVPVEMRKLTWKWPFVKKVVVTKDGGVYETVEQTLRRTDVADLVRFIVDIPGFNEQQVTIYKLRKSDAGLSTRLEEKSDEALDQLSQLLAS